MERDNTGWVEKEEDYRDKNIKLHGGAWRGL